MLSAKEEGRQRSQGQGTSAVSGVRFLGSAAATGRVEGWSPGCFHSWRARAPGPTVTAVQFPVAMSATVPERLEWYALPLLQLLKPSGPCGAPRQTKGRFRTVAIMQGETNRLKGKKRVQK